MKGRKSETAIVRDAMQLLAWDYPDAIIWRANSGSNGKAGHRCNSINLPDIVGWQKNGLALAVEVKTAIGRLSIEQLAFLADVNSRGGMAAIYIPSQLIRLRDIPDRHLPHGWKNADGAFRSTMHEWKHS